MYGHMLTDKPVSFFTPLFSNGNLSLGLLAGFAVTANGNTSIRWSIFQSNPIFVRATVRKRCFSEQSALVFGVGADLIAHITSVVVGHSRFDSLASRFGSAIKVRSTQSHR